MIDIVRGMLTDYLFPACFHAISGRSHDFFNAMTGIIRFSSPRYALDPFR